MIKNYNYKLIKRAICRSDGSLHIFGQNGKYYIKKVNIDNFMKNKTI